MPLLTLTTDFGIQSHFVSQLRGNILQVLPDVQVLDISHSIAPFNLMETSFLMRNSIFHYPSRTIHAIGVDSNLRVYKALVIAQCDDQFMVAADNGVIPLILGDRPFRYKRIPETDSTHFSFKNSFPHFIRKLLDLDFNLDQMEGEEQNIRQMVVQKPVVSGALVTFNILYIDNFGNAYTTLTRDFFNEVVGEKDFQIQLSRFEKVDRIHTGYADVAEGQKVCFFDENGYMVIAINRGRADQLLGLRRESSQMILEVFEEVRI